MIDPDSDLVREINDLSHNLFPNGVAAVTMLTYVAQLAAVESLLSTLADQKPLMKKLALEGAVERLRELAVKYREALEVPAKGPDANMVREARAIGQNYLLQVTAMILGNYHGTSANHRERREQLLVPILDQNEAIRSYLRARRPIEDVNPESGEIESRGSTQRSYCE